MGPMNNLNPMKVLLSIVDPEYPNDIQVEEIAKDRGLLQSAIKLAEKNGLYYYFINKLREQNIDILLGEEHWNEEERGLSDFKETITLLNAASKESCISYILIKDCNSVIHIPRDVDIFVRAGEKEDMIKALDRYGVKCEHSGSIETTLVGESYFPIDLYTKIIYFGNEFLDEDFLFNFIEEKEIFGIRYPGLNSEAEFMLTLLHSLFGHRRLTLLDFLHLKRLKDRGLSFKFCESYARNRNWESVFTLALEKFNLIKKEVYEEKKEIVFPYLFDIKFVMKCIQQINEISLSQSDKILINFSLFLDGAKLKLEDSMFYNTIKKCTPLRKALLSIGYRSRSMRGDKYS